MSSKIVQFFADAAKSIREYPITMTRCVYDADGKRLDDILDDLPSNNTVYVSTKFPASSGATLKMCDYPEGFDKDNCCAEVVKFKWYTYDIWYLFLPHFTRTASSVNLTIGDDGLYCFVGGDEASALVGHDCVVRFSKIN